MSSKIRVLSDHTINKIAAGEVIENPASVIKELVENSIDAGATDICVEIKGGGRQLIRVTDNGGGMSPDDALLCLERHATSKIHAVEDLETLGTMGFRGEALPSIAAISKFMLTTCPPTEPGKTPQGTLVIVDGGHIIKCCPAACASGTTIEVKNLFFNVPVRKKFLKAPAYDVQEILKTLTLLALGNPAIKFQLINNQETVLNAPAGLQKTFEEQLSERVAAVLGTDFLHSLCPIQASKNEIVLQGFIGLPIHTRHNRTGQYLFINQRAVVSNYIAYALREAYGPMLGANRYPLFVLHVTLPGSLVDVNVHPQKREVRLRQEHTLKELLMQAVEGALQQTGVSPVVELPPLPWEVAPPPASFSATPPPQPVNPLPQPKRVSIEEPQLFKHEVQKPIALTPRVLTTLPGYILIDPTVLQRFAYDGLCLVDQRSAHARIIYEKIAATTPKSIPVQTLLIPYTFECTPVQATGLKQQLQHLNKVGISLREFGPTTFVIDAVPQIFGHADIGELLGDLLKQIELDKTFHEEHARCIALAASRAAISKSKRMPLEEAQSLMQQLMQCNTPYLCPQGKPTMIQISNEELAKLFTKAPAHGLS